MSMRLKALKCRIAAVVTCFVAIFLVISTTHTNWTRNMALQSYSHQSIDLLRTTTATTPSAPKAYVITPTYQRPTQEADLLRLCYTLMQAPHVWWIIVEDSDDKTELVQRIAKECKVPDITHLVARTRLLANESHRGVTQRNTGLAWVRNNVLPSSRAGGVYFADDDNTYDLRVFDVVRNTTKMSTWKVGIVGGLLEEGPVCVNGKVIGWTTGFSPRRKYPIDMAAFAVGLDLLAQEPGANFSHTSESGHLETDFITLFNVSSPDITTAPDGNCSRVLAWHTKTVLPEVDGTPVFVVNSERQEDRAEKLQ
ncbi:galactosylgalactosylxylosylprotein 3-beta-glucuronosyltransferase 3-like isoform X1 [Pomacea canaliculata]|uniref:galactosylgalactosylxylosylprotein 3-beta-glucuronosyltransferase 3-like isoform X1 n=1 Tax=Pomacea canaliculata TaxID=400727 RepID=UPI000D73E0ED|nr:galactosylgalactosylxylosylprotein 3-beta-glucuronosyltransferase 3-like isoform X1 [Pomacea canaliculata]